MYGAIWDVEQLNRLCFACLANISRRNYDANKHDFKLELDLTFLVKSTFNRKKNLAPAFCTSGPNLVILAGMGDVADKLKKG